KMLLSELAPLVNAHQGSIYHNNLSENTGELMVLATYADAGGVRLSDTIKLGEGLVGECALQNRRILLTDVPAEYVKISSSLGAAAKLSVVVLPVLYENQTKAVIELASLQPFTAVNLNFLDQLALGIG